MAYYYPLLWVNWTPGCAGSQISLGEETPPWVSPQRSPIHTVKVTLSGTHGAGIRKASARGWLIPTGEVALSTRLPTAPSAVGAIRHLHKTVYVDALTFTRHICPHAPPPKLLFTNFPMFIFLSLFAVDQRFSHCSWVFVDLYQQPFPVLHRQWTTRCTTWEPSLWDNYFPCTVASICAGPSLNQTRYCQHGVWIVLWISSFISVI